MTKDETIKKREASIDDCIQAVESLKLSNRTRDSKWITLRIYEVYIREAYLEIYNTFEERYTFRF